MKLINHIEAILFAIGDEGIKLKQLANILQVSDKILLENIANYQKELTGENRGLNLYIYNNHIKLLTKANSNLYLEKIKNEAKIVNLSIPAIEVMSIIAAKEPITKTDVENIRGVNCDGIFLKLKNLELIKVVDRSNEPGMPMLYGVTKKFYDLFQFNNKDEVLGALQKIDQNPVENIFE